MCIITNLAALCLSAGPLCSKITSSILLEVSQYAAYGDILYMIRAQCRDCITFHNERAAYKRLTTFPFLLILFPYLPDAGLCFSAAEKTTYQTKGEN